MTRASQKHFKSILVFAIPSLGDVLLTTPLLRSLRRAYPDSVLDAMVYRGHDDILQGNPDVNTTFTVTKHPGLREYWRLFRRIFRRYDLAISTGTSDRAQIYMLAAGRTRLSVVPPQNHSWKRRLLHGHVPVDAKVHTVLEIARLGDLLGIERCYDVVAPRVNGLQPGLEKLSISLGDGYAVIHAIPGMRYKRWTEAGWIEIGRFLRGRGLRVFLTGGRSRDERDLVASICESIGPGAVSLAGELSFAEVADLLRGCRVYAGPDTVVTHLAAAVGAPTVALFGPTRPDKWGPWPKGYRENRVPYPPVGSRRVRNVHLLQGLAPCVPCGLQGCERHRFSRSDCLDQLPASRVVQALEGMLTAPADRRISADAEP